ncbi:MAG: hypothetical protein NZ108_11190, partial [Bacteroidia bacterium]|nr:hypothetical protein [Bacteroidia bacterium]
MKTFSLFRRVISILTLLTLHFSIYAQVSTNYTFSQSSGTYTSLTGGTVHFTGNFDDGTAPVTLPFTFTYNGVPYTQVHVTANGYIVFGATDPTNGVWTNASVISGTLVTTGAVAGWAGDLNGWTGTVGGQTSEVRSQILGSAPNRVAVFQWRCRPAYSTSTANIAYLSVQIQLEETTNIVRIVYGPSSHLIGSTNISTSRQVGLRGATNSDFNNRTNPTTVSFNSSSAGTVNTATQAFSSINSIPGRPNNGLTYTWTPASCISPGGLTATNITVTSADLSWNAVVPTPANGYQ